jgi:hypothetical protein
MPDNAKCRAIEDTARIPHARYCDMHGQCLIMRSAWAMEDTARIPHISNLKPDNAKCMGDSDTSYKCLIMRNAWAMPNNAKCMGNEIMQYAWAIENTNPICFYYALIKCEMHGK